MHSGGGRQHSFVTGIFIGNKSPWSPHPRHKLNVSSDLWQRRWEGEWERNQGKDYYERIPRGRVVGMRMVRKYITGKQTGADMQLIYVHLQSPQSPHSSRKHLRSKWEKIHKTYAWQVNILVQITGTVDYVEVGDKFENRKYESIYPPTVGDYTNSISNML